MKNQNRLRELESEKQSLEQVYERTSNLYGQTIRERHQMTKTWSTAVQTLNARHSTIHEIMEVRTLKQVDQFTLSKLNQFFDFF